MAGKLTPRWTFAFFSKAKSDSDSLLFAEENPLVGWSHSKKNFAESIYLFEISTFLVQRPLLGRFTILLTISKRRWSKTFFMRVMNKKPFLRERASVNLPQALNSDRGSGSSWSRFFTFFHFHLTWKWAKYAKISKNRVENSEKSWSPKIR